MRVITPLNKYMKHKFDISEIETDECWEIRKFRRDHYVMCAIMVVLLAIAVSL